MICHFSESELYTEVGIHHYSAPPGFCFDVGCDDEPIMDNPDLHDYNKDERIDTFLNIAREDFAKFKEGPANKHLIYTMGEDFQVGNDFSQLLIGSPHAFTNFFHQYFSTIFFSVCEVQRELSFLFRQKWYFVTKIVLTYCEKKLFS